MTIMRLRPGSRVGWLLAFACLLLQVGPARSEPPVLEAQPLILTPIGGPAPVDRRTEFADAFCPLLAGAGSCKQFLRLPEPRGVESTSAPANEGRQGTAPRILFLPGIFAECIEDRVRPFEDVMPMVESRLHLETELLMLPGRMGTRHNAALVTARLRKIAAEGRDMIIVGYSKGGLDGLHAVAETPDVQSHVKAVLTLATPVFGSPAADQLGVLYTNTLGSLPIPRCRETDGEDVKSLSEAENQAWWQSHRLPDTIPVYAIAAAPDPDRVSKVLRVSFEQMWASHGWNDSQVPLQNAFAPGAQVLAIINADHWAAAMPSHKMLPIAQGLFVDDFPRGALLTTALEIILNDLKR